MRKSLSHALDAAPTNTLICRRSSTGGTPGELSTFNAPRGDNGRFSSPAEKLEKLLLLCLVDLLEGDKGGVHFGGTTMEPKVAGRGCGSCGWCVEGLLSALDSWFFCW